MKRSCVLQLGGGFLEVFGSFLSCRVFRFPPPHSPCHRPLSKGTWFFSLFFSPEPCILEAALPPAPAPSAPFPWSVPFFPLVSLWSAWDGLCLPGGEWFNSEPCLWLPSPVSRGLLPLLDPRSPGGSGDGHFSCLPTVMSNFGCPLRSQFLCDFTFPSLLLRVVSQGYLKGKEPGGRLVFSCPGVCGSPGPALQFIPSFPRPEKHVCRMGMHLTLRVLNLDSCGLLDSPGTTSDSSLCLGVSLSRAMV